MSNAVISSSSSVASSTSSSKRRGGKTATVVSVQRLQCFKTKRCRFWLEGRCTRGSNCTYAHTDVELRVPPNLTKTKICARWRRGTCGNAASDCAYAHGQEDMRDLAPDSACAAVSPTDFSTRSSGSTLGSFESSHRSSPRTDEEEVSDEDPVYEYDDEVVEILAPSRPEINLCSQQAELPSYRLSTPMDYYYNENDEEQDSPAEQNQRALLGAQTCSCGADMGPVYVLHSLTMTYSD